MNNFISQKQSAFDLFKKFKLEEFFVPSTTEIFYSWKNFSSFFIKTKKLKLKTVEETEN